MALRRADSVGYGRRPPQITWPDGCLVAVNLVVCYEDGSEYSLFEYLLVPSPLPETFPYGIFVTGRLRLVYPQQIILIQCFRYR